MIGFEITYKQIKTKKYLVLDCNVQIDKTGLKNTE